MSKSKGPAVIQEQIIRELNQRVAQKVNEAKVRLAREVFGGLYEDEAEAEGGDQVIEKGEGKEKKDKKEDESGEKSADDDEAAAPPIGSKDIQSKNVGGKRMNNMREALSDDGKATVKVSVPKDEKVEAYGVKGMKSTPWRKTFKNADALNKWLETNDAECHGTRTSED